MAGVVMNMNGCDLAHEALMLKEFGEAKNCMSPGLHPAGNDAVAKPTRQLRTDSRHLKAVPSAAEDVIDRVTVLSSAFPKCP